MLTKISNSCSRLITSFLYVTSRLTYASNIQECANIASIKQDLFAGNNILDDEKWTDTIYQHISYRFDENNVLIPQNDKQFNEVLINDLSTIYNNIYSNRQDINVILHVQNSDITSISYDSDGILPLDQQYYAVYPISYSITELQQNKESYILLLPKGNGVLCMGKSMHDAYYRLWFLLSAAQSQITTLSIMDKKDIIIPPKQVQLNTLNGVMNPPNFVGYEVGIPEFEAFKRKFGYTDTNITLKDRGNENISFLKFREELAHLYNLIGKMGLDEMIYNHITARIPVNISNIAENDDNYTDYLLINPFGLSFSEITATNLIEFITKVEIDENNPDKPSKYKVLNGGDTIQPFNGRVFNSGLELHASVHSFRNDINVVIHIHNAALTAVGAYKYGLLPLNKLYYDMIKPISYHSYGNFAKRQNKMQIIQDIGTQSNVVILRNHGVLAMGKTIDEAFNRLYYMLELAKLQVNVMKMGLLTDDILKEMLEYIDNDTVTTTTTNLQLNVWERFKIQL